MLSVLVSLLVGGVELTPGAPCVDGRSAERLAAQVPAEVGVTLARAKPDVLVVVLSAPGRSSLRREVPASAAECEAVERVVLALVRSWWSTSVVSSRRRTDAGVVAPDLGAAAVRDAGVVARELDAGTTSSSRGESIAFGGGVSGSTSGSREVFRLDAGNVGFGGRESIGVDAVRVDAGSVGGRESSGVDAGLGGSGSSIGLRQLSKLDVGDVGFGGRESIGVDAGLSASLGVDAGSVSGAGVDAGLSASGGSSSPDGVDGGDASAGADTRARASDWRLGLSVLGGVSSGTTADVLPQGLLSFDLGWRWLGVAVDIGLSGAVKQAVAPGEVVASWQWLSFSGRAVWSPTERLLLDVQLGARAHRLVASATGFTMNEPAQSLLSVGGVGSVGASLRLLGPFGVVMRATGVLKPPERFVITNVPQSLDFGALEGAVHAGLFARW
ncbi:MAG: hypothetical protein JNM69_22020 [Archangium sp.]|nr:hypothetical protein [Archangium sp.]